MLAVIKDVFLPWYNAYRFFVQNTRRLELEKGVIFTYDVSKEIHVKNAMDVWILAATQSLIKYFHQEMAAYRLYTVIPKLIKFIEELTNWYVRFNRKRLKGENGDEDCNTALHTLFEVLFTLCKLMAPFTPFLTESMYQNLRLALPKTNEDNRSVHFLLLPQPKEEYFNDDIQRRVSLMQRVIDLGRVARERRALSLKNPLPEVIVVHKDPKVLEDIASLESYITEELNVKQLILTSDEAKYEIKSRAEPDFKLLGQRLGESLKTVGPQIKALSQQAIQDFLRDGFVVVAGQRIEANEISVVRYFESSELQHLQANADKDLVIILNCEASDKSLVHEGIAREVVNRVQRLRKELELSATDDVHTFFQVVDDAGNNLAEALAATQDFITKTLKRGIVPKKSYDQSKVLAEREVEVKGSKVNLILVKA